MLPKRGADSLEGWSAGEGAGEGLRGRGHDSFRCIAEIITILESNYPPIKK